MKKILKFTIILLSISCMYSACSKNDEASDFVVDYAILPISAKDFISTNFNGIDVSVVRERYEAQADGTFYKVSLMGGYFFDFDKYGDWITVGGSEKELPWSIFSESSELALIKTYITENHPTEKVAAIQIRMDKQYQIDLVSGIQLFFDERGYFLNKK